MKQKSQFRPLVVAMGFMIATFVSLVPAPEPVSAAGNGNVVFIRNNSIYTMDPAGTNITQLTSGSTDDCPVWSPDGTKIAYSNLGREAVGRSLFIMDADGSNDTLIPTGLELMGGGYGCHSWSPDGSKIVVTGADGQLYIVDISDGSSASIGLGYDPDWSPDGSKIAYTADSYAEIYTMNVDGTGSVKITDGNLPPADAARQPDWSPDGSRIAFEVFSDADYAPHVYTMDPDGLNLSQLTDEPFYFNAIYGIDWSPDGTKIVYGVRYDGYNEIHMMNADGTSQVKVTDNSGDFSTSDSRPSWQPTGVTLGTSSGSSTQISADLAPTISLSTSGSVDINLNPASGTAMSSASDTLSVSTNGSTGYSLSLENADTNTELRKGSDVISKHLGTQASPTALSLYRWGYRVDSVGGFGAGPTSQENNVSSSSYNWAGVPALGSANQIKSTTGVASNDVTTVWYGVRIDSGTESGVYTDTVTYTAVTN